MIEFSIETIPAGEISKDEFKVAFIKNPTDFMVDLACSGIGLELWGDAVALSFHPKIKEELVEKYIKLLGSIDINPIPVV